MQSYEQRPIARPIGEAPRGCMGGRCATVAETPQLQHGMQTWVLVAAAVACAVARVQAALFAPNGPVVHVTTRNFDAEVKNIEKPVLLAFTAPWCGHCQNLAPEFTRAAATLDGVVKFANVDCEDAQARQLCAQHGVQGFPTIKLFPPTKKRVPRDYPGERTAQALVDYAVDSLPAIAARKLDPKYLQPFLEKNPKHTKVVLFSAKSRSSPMYRALALDYRTKLSFVYLWAEKEDVRAAAEQEMGVKVSKDNLPALYVVTPGKDGGKKPSFELYNGPMKYRAIREWLEPFARRALDKTKHPVDERYPSPDERERIKRAAESIAREAREMEMRGEPLPDEKEGGADSVLMRQLRGLVGHDWSPALHAKSEQAKREALEVLEQSPEQIADALTRAEHTLLTGFEFDRRLLQEQLDSGLDENGFKANKRDLEEARTKLDILSKMINTIHERGRRRGVQHNDAVREANQMYREYLAAKAGGAKPKPKPRVDTEPEDAAHDEL